MCLGFMSSEGEHVAPAFEIIYKLNTIHFFLNFLNVGNALIYSTLLRVVGIPWRMFPLAVPKDLIHVHICVQLS